ncbi:MAG: FmdE family protein [Methanobacteriaceae archaeon]|nr:FmdE family protein [Methanobacteriaceae archaeon]
MISIKKQGIKRQIVLMTLAVLLTLFICGTVSAEDLSSTGGNGSDVQSTVIDNQTAIGPIIGVKVGYEYSSDNSINPEITVKDNNGTKIAYNKTYDMAFQGYKLSFLYPGAVNGTKFNVTVAASGYTTQIKEIGVLFDPNNASDPNLYGSSTFNMIATANYKLGRTVTSKADQILNFSKADNVLVITTAGVPKLNGVTSEDCIEGILNAGNGKFSYGKNNVLMLRQTAMDPVDFAFITKKGTNLQVVVFRNGSTTPVYTGTISENMTRAQWNTFVQKVNSENAWSFASLANAWAAGAPADVLREAAFHGHVCEGTLGGYSITKALLQYYPPKQATIGGTGSPADLTSYKILGVPGDSDDDAVMYFLDATPGKGGYAGFDTTSTGATKNMLGFIRWTDTTYKVVTNTDGSKSYVVNVAGTGDLVVMSYDKAKLKKAFQTETGITSSGSLEELKYNTWLLNKIKSNPTQLVDFYYELTGLTEEQFYYLLGTAANVTFPNPKNNPENATNNGTVRFVMQDAHGLDINYIKSLNLTNATRSNNITNNSQLTYDQIKQIGIDAANLAKQTFKNELGIDLEKDDMDLAILTSAGYIYLNGQTTEATWDGIFDVFGSRLSRSTLLPIHMGIWKPLWFTFVLRGLDGNTMNTVYLRYNSNNNSFFVGTNTNSSQVNDIGPKALNNATKVSNLSKFVIPDGNWANIQSIANAWRNDPAFDQLITFLFHNHACPGVQPGFFMTDYIQKNFPLSGNQSYFWTASSIYCKDDSLIYLLGVSPGMGSYMNQRMTNDETASEYLPGGTEEGIIVVWDSVTKTGKAAIISFKWPTFDLTGLTTNEAKREAQIAAFIAMYNGESSPYIATPLSIVQSEDTYLTEDQYKALQQGNALEKLKSWPKKSLADLLAKQGGSTNNGTHVVDNSGSTNNGGSNNNGASNNGGSNNNGPTSVGVSPTSVSAASETTTQPADAKSYEVSEKSSTKQDSNNNWAYALVGILAIGGLVGFGFMRSKN